MAIFKEIAKADGSGIVEYHRIQNGMIVNMDYNKIANKPTINGVELIGDLKSEDLKIEGGASGGKGLTIVNINDLGLRNEELLRSGKFTDRVIYKTLQELPIEDINFDEIDGIEITHNLEHSGEYDNSYKMLFLKQGTAGVHDILPIYHNDKKISVEELSSILNVNMVEYERIYETEGEEAAEAFLNQLFSLTYVVMSETNFVCVELSTNPTNNKLSTTVRHLQFSLVFDRSSFGEGDYSKARVIIHLKNEYVNGSSFKRHLLLHSPGTIGEEIEGASIPTYKVVLDEDSQAMLQSFADEMLSVVQTTAAIPNLEGEISTLVYDSWTNSTWHHLLTENIPLHFIGELDADAEEFSIQVAGESSMFIPELKKTLTKKITVAKDPEDNNFYLYVSYPDDELVVYYQ